MTEVADSKSIGPTSVAPGNPSASSNATWSDGRSARIRMALVCQDIGILPRNPSAG